MPERPEVSIVAGVVDPDGRPFSGVIVDGGKAELLTVWHGKGLRYGPLSSGYMRQLGQQLIEAAADREQAEDAAAEAVSAELGAIFKEADDGRA